MIKAWIIIDKIEGFEETNSTDLFVNNKNIILIIISKSKIENKNNKDLSILLHGISQYEWK